MEFKKQECGVSDVRNIVKSLYMKIEDLINENAAFQSLVVGNETGKKVTLAKNHER